MVLKALPFFKEEKMEKRTTGKRNQTIDFFRFAFAVIIMFHHSRYLLGDENCMFLGGSLGVEFYFLVSGYLLMASVMKQKHQGGPVSISKETFAFLKHKLKFLYPEVAVAWGIAFGFTCVACQYGIKDVAKRFLNCCLEPFLLFSFGLIDKSVNGVTWYLSSMLLAMAILYPLLRKYPTAMKYLIMPLSALFLLGWMCLADGHPRNPTKWIGWTYKGNLRAMAELELGALSFFAAQRIRRIPFNRVAKLLLTVVEVGCYIINVLYMFYETPSRRDIFFIALLCLGICLSFSGQTLLSGMPESRAVFWLGKFSFPLYLSNLFYATSLNEILPETFTDIQRMTVYISCAFVTALVVGGISDLLRKNSGRILQAGKRFFLEKGSFEHTAVEIHAQCIGK